MLSLYAQKPDMAPRLNMTEKIALTADGLKANGYAHNRGSVFTIFTYEEASQELTKHREVFFINLV